MSKPKKSEHMIVWIKWEETEDENDWNKKGLSYEEQEAVSYDDEEGPQMAMAIPSFMMKPMMPVKVVAEKDFNFWMGHTTFPISNRILDIITVCPGVETLDILTPYRFRIATGLLFPPGEVMSGIAQAVIGYLQTHEQSEVQPRVN